jgi:anti-sigma B factor antagonist
MPTTQEATYTPSAAEKTVFTVEQTTIDAGNAWEIRPVLLRALYEVEKELVVDLSRVSFIDSTGLGMLVSLLKEARHRQSDVRLVNASREVRRILQVTGLEKLFELQTAAR